MTVSAPPRAIDSVHGVGSAATLPAIDVLRELGGWLVESLATQTLVIFAIRTRRVPFFRSHPSLPLVLAALGVVAVGALLPATPLAQALGFQPLPGAFYAVLAGTVVGYLVLIEIGKRIFYRTALATAPAARRPHSGQRHLKRRAAHFSTARRSPRLTSTRRR